jgi:hypothetical protein
VNAKLNNLSAHSCGYPSRTNESRITVRRRVVMLVLWVEGSLPMTLNLALKPHEVDAPRPPGILHTYFFGPQTSIGWGAAIALIILAFAPLSVSRANTTRGGTPGTPSGDSLARPCKSTASGSKPSKRTRKTGKQNLSDANAQTSQGCLEVHSTALEIQEFLQAHGREEKWKLIEEQVGEDAWTFSRKLEKDELLQYTTRDAESDGVNWTSGVVFVQLRTVELAAGFVRVQISARFQGYGQNQDRFAPPRESWPLSSNAGLENHLISVLEAHFKNAS